MLPYARDEAADGRRHRKPEVALTGTEVIDFQAGDGVSAPPNEHAYHAPCLSRPDPIGNGGGGVRRIMLRKIYAVTATGAASDCVQGFQALSQSCILRRHRYAHESSAYDRHFLKCNGQAM
jgi:hypothetical protein